MAGFSWRSAWVAPALLILMTAALAVRSLSLSRNHPFPIYDEVAYLDLARGFAQEGGVSALVGDYAAGRCLEDNRHPLYTMLLTPLMDGTPADFARAKLATLGCAILLVLAMFLISRSLWGEGIALAAAAAVALSPATAELSQTAAADMLFAALYAAAALILAGLADAPLAWGAYGFLAGLAYLAKGNGHFLLLSALAVGLGRGRLGFFRRRELYLALASFAAGASLVLWRNSLVWGSPFHSVNTKNFWLDDWASFWSLSVSPEWRRVGFAWYFERHGLLQALERLLWGLRVNASVLVSAMAVGPRAGTWVSGPLLVGLAAFGLWDAWRKRLRALPLALLAPAAALFLAFAWISPVVVGLRFIYPIAVSLVPAAAMGAGALLKRWRASAWISPGMLKTALALSCLAVLATRRDGLRADPRGLWRLPLGWHETSRWIEAHVDKAGFLIDNGSLYSNWDTGRDRRRPYPLQAPAAEIEDFLRRQKIRVAVVDRHLLKGEQSGGNYGPSDAHGPMSFLRWPRCFYAPASPSVLLTFSRDCAAPGAANASSP